MNDARERGDTTRSRKRGPLRILGGMILLVLLILSALIILALLIRPIERVTRMVEERLSAELGEEVRISLVTVRFLPDVQVTAHDVRLLDDETSQEIGSAREIWLDPTLLPLFKGNVVVEKIVVHGPRADLVRNDDGKWNVEELWSNIRRRPDDARERDGRLMTRQIEIRNGSIRLDDRPTDNVVTAENVKGTIDIENDFAELGSATFTASPLKGTISGRLDQMTTADRSLTATANMKIYRTGPLAGLRTGDLPEGEWLAEATAEAKGLLGNLGIQASFSVNGRLTENLETGGSLTAGLDSYEGHMKVADLQLNLGGSAASFTGSVDKMWTEKLAMNLEGTSRALLEELTTLTSSELVSAIEPQGPLDASVDITGSRSAVELTANLDLTPTTLSIPRVARKEPRTGGSLQFTARLEFPDEVVLERYELDVANAIFTGAGRLKKTAEPWAHVSVKTNKIALRRMDKIPLVRFDEGTVALNAEVWQASRDAEKTGFAVDGSIERAFAEVEGLTDPIQELYAKIKADHEGVTVTSSSFWFEGSRHEFKGQMRGFDKPRLTGTLRSEMVNVDQVIASVQGVAEKLRQRSDGEPRGKSEFELKLLVVADSIYAGGIRTEFTKATIEISGDSYRFEPVEAKVFEGDFRGSLKLDASEKPTLWSLTFTGENWSLENLLEQLNAKTRNMTGALIAEGALNGEAGGNFEDVLRSVNGKLKLTAKDGKVGEAPIIKTVYMAMQAPALTMFVPGLRELALLNTLIDAARTGGRSLDPTTNTYTKIEGNFDLKEGVAHTEDLRLESGVANLICKGDFNLAERTVDLKITAVPLGSIGSVLGAVPIAGEGLQRAQESTVSMDFIARGPIDNPKIDLAMVDLLKKKGQRESETEEPVTVHPEAEQ